MVSWMGVRRASGFWKGYERYAEVCVEVAGVRGLLGMLGHGDHRERLGAA